MRRWSRRALLQGATGLAASCGTAKPTVARATTPLRLRRGVNAWPWFSLTKEFPAPRTDYAWPPFQDQRPVPTPGDLRRLRTIGFDFVRLPVDPGPFLSGTEDQRRRLLDMLFRAVEQILDAHLSVVVNLQANGATHFWTPDRMIGSVDAPAFPAYRRLVRDIARGLARFDVARVALEPVNEPPQACVSDGWTAVQAALLVSGREGASDLTLLVTGGCGSMISGLTALDPKPLQATGPVLFTFHFYEPYLFSHQGAPWMREPVYRSLNAVPWPASKGSLERTLDAVRVRMNADHERSPEEKRAAYTETERVLDEYFAAQPDRWFITKYFEMVRGWAEQHGISSNTIVLGEFGALRTDARYTAGAAPDRARYIRDVRETAEAFGYPWAFWNLFDGMGLMDDVTRALDPAIVAALGLTALPG